jgi:hypothetical protein
MRTVVVEVPTTRIVEVEADTLDVLKETTPKVIEVGITGSQGAQGVPGGGFNYVHTQTVASTVWIIVHNLNGFPNITVADSAGTVVEGDVVYVDSNTIQLTFSAPFSGTAYLS